MNCTSSGMIDVILADHQNIFRIGMARALATEDDIRIVGQPQSGEQLLRSLQSLQPRVAVLSSAFIDEIQKIRELCDCRRTAILLLQNQDEAEFAHLSLKVQGVVRRSADEETMVRSIRQLARGGRVLCLVRPAGGVAHADPVGYRVKQRMSPQELRIIGLAVQGFRNREIAVRMGTTEHFVKNSLSRIFDKAGVFDRLELALYVVNHGALKQAIREVREVQDLREVAITRGGWTLPRNIAVN